MLMAHSLSGEQRQLATLVELLRERAMHQPDQRAYTYLTDGEREDTALSYGELDRAARAIAVRLGEMAAPGDRALLVYPQGLDYVAAFFGCLYAGVIAVPTYPPHAARLERTLPRVRGIAQDAQPAIVCTTAAILDSSEALFALAPDFRDRPWLATDTLDRALVGSWQPPAISAATLAFLQYTSGSTAAPKGVMVSHGNLVRNLAGIDHGWTQPPEGALVSWLPIFHDLGLIYGVLLPLFKAIPGVLLSPTAFSYRPLRWLQAIARYGATHSAAPNFAYDLCAQKISAEQRAQLDLSRWIYALNGAEPVRAQTLERFAAAFAASGFRSVSACPAYGLAEATLVVTSSRQDEPPVAQTVRADALEAGLVEPCAADAPDSRTLVSSGRALIETEVLIVDPETRLACPAAMVGEIWVAGPGVAQGYWQLADASEATFGARLADTGAGPFLRTGDLGFLQAGELFVTGRLKDLIIIDGRNHYPQDIELTAEQSHAALRPNCAAAFALDDGADEQLVVAIEVDRHHRSPSRAAEAEPAPAGQRPPLDPHEVARAIRRAVAAQHDIEVAQVVLLKTGTIPKTSSGKIQRSACRARLLAGTLEVWGA